MLPYQLKVRGIILGDVGVGKSSLLRAVVGSFFSPSHIHTIGCDIGARNVELPDSTVVKIQLVDTAGDVRFRSITESYLQSAAFAWVIYDVNDTNSQIEAARWVKRALKITQDVTLIGNKTDLGGPVDMHLAQQLGVAHASVCAKTGDGVTRLLHDVASRFYYDVASQTVLVPVLQTTKYTPPPRNLCCCLAM